MLKWLAIKMRLVGWLITRSACLIPFAKYIAVTVNRVHLNFTSYMAVFGWGKQGGQNCSDI